ncbi:MAG: flippase-like domain-containing protein, partial [Bacteroidales bacterium]|nr:flippase-like domain-containing protein [Bacteroidales bacterium]
MSFLKSKFGKILQWLLLLLLAIVFLYFAFSGVKWDDFINGIESCNFWWILASMVVSVIAFVVRALRWRLAMLPLSDKITRMDAYRGVTVGYLVNFALPRAGEFA